MPRYCDDLCALYLGVMSAARYSFCSYFGCISKAVVVRLLLER